MKWIGDDRGGLPAERGDVTEQELFRFTQKFEDDPRLSNTAARLEDLQRPRRAAALWIADETSSRLTLNCTLRSESGASFTNE